MTITTEVQTGTALMEKTVCLQLSISAPGNRKKADKDKIDAQGADKRMLHFSKSKLDSSELDAVYNHNARISGYARSVSVPSPLMKSGNYMVAFEMIERVDETLNRMFAEGWELVEQFLNTYPQRIDESLERLGPQGNRQDYPSVAQMRSSFDYRFSYITFQTPEKLSSIDSEIFQREMEKAKVQWAEAEQVAETLLLSEYKRLVDHMADRLTPDTDGGKKIFKEATVKNLAEFLKTCPFRNVSNNEELTVLTEQMRELLKGVDGKMLRDSDVLRKDVSESVEMIKARLDQAVANRPMRKIRFDDD